MDLLAFWVYTSGENPKPQRDLTQAAMVSHVGGLCSLGSMCKILSLRMSCFPDCLQFLQSLLKVISMLTVDQTSLLSQSEDIILILAGKNVLDIQG